jgi:peptidyl-prolyl cis-trans isomerase B (cyclophilin B)
MEMKRSTLFSAILLILFISGCAQNKKDFVVTISTPYGEMVAVLYDETPKHKANFIELARKNFYDSLIFHRVMQSFMIQGGDPNSKNASPQQPLGDGGPGYEIDAEFNPKYFHKRGALSAARRGPGNSEKKSSGSQFYVVQGKKMTDVELTQLEQNIQYQRKNQNLGIVLDMPECANVRQQVIDMQRANNTEWLRSFFENADTLIQEHIPDYREFSFSDAQRKAYTEIGGAPHLDGDYTVFGEVIKGLDVIDKIAEQPIDPRYRPKEDIRMKVSVVELSRKKIEKLYGYQYPD